MNPTRRAAFARTPRGAAVNNDSQRNRRLIRIDKRFLDEFAHARVSNEMSTVLTNCDAEIQVNLGPNGNGNYKMVDRHGRVIADEADFVKIQSLGSFINEERKAILKTSVSTKTQRILASMVALNDILAKGKEFTFTKSFVDTFRTVQAQMDTLTHNVSIMDVVKEDDTKNSVVKAFITEMAIRIRVAAVNFLVHRATLGKDDQPRKINEFLEDSKVMVWTFAKLTSAKLPALTREHEARHVLFPRDPTKGMAILFREWRNKELVENQLGLLEGMKNFQGLLSDERVRMFCGVPDSWDLDASGPKDPARVLMPVPILVPVPEPLVDSGEFFSALGRTGDRGMSWASGNGTDPAAVLKFMGTLPKRTQCGFFQSPRLKTVLLESMFAGFKFDAADEAVRGVYAQLARWGQSIDTPTWFGKCVAEKGQLSRILSAVRITMVISGEKELAKNLTSAFAEGENPPMDRKAPVPMVDPWGQITTAAQGMSSELVEKTLRGKIEAGLTSAKKRKETKAFLTARTQLTVQGTGLLGQFRQRHYGELAERVGEWLRTFLSTGVQAVVADLLAARLEAHLSSPVEVGREELASVLDHGHFDWAEDVNDGLAESDAKGGAGDEKDDEEVNPDDA